MIFGRRLLACLLLGALAGPAWSRTVVDATGRSVEVPDRIERVLPAGPPAAVLLYTLAPQVMIGWTRVPSPAAALLDPAAAALPAAPPLMRDGKVDAAQIKDARPDLILDYGSVTARYVERARDVQQATGVPVLLLTAGSTAPLRSTGCSARRWDRRARRRACFRSRTPPRGRPRASRGARHRTGATGLLCAQR